MTLVIVVGVGIRGGVTGCTKLCCCTVMLPPEVAAKACICCATQAVAAPMPRFGSSWLDKVCRVPNSVRRWMVAVIRLASIRCNSIRRAGSKLAGLPSRLRPADAAKAGAACETMGAAMAVTAEAERKARRLRPFGPAKELSSMPRIKNGSMQMSSNGGDQPHHCLSFGQPRLAQPFAVGEGGCSGGRALRISDLCGGPGVEVENARMQGGTLLERSSDRAVESVLEIELPIPLDDMGEQVSVVGRVGCKQCVEVQLALRRDELLEPHLARWDLCPLTMSLPVGRVGSPVADALEDHG